MNSDIQEILMSDYLRVPTPILQMQRVLKNGNTYACLQFIWAKTGGWNQSKDTISYSQFSNDKRYGTGLSTKTIQRAIEKLSNMGAITVKPSFNSMYEFSVNLERIYELVGAEVRSNSPHSNNEVRSNSPRSQDNLSASQDNLSTKSGQNDLHTITTTLKPLHNNKTKEADEDEQSKPPVKKINPVTQQANSLIDFWNDNHGKGDSANIKHKVWVGTLKTRLKTFTEDEIKTAMLSVINSHWHQQNKQVLIKNAIDSDKRCEQAISKYRQAATANNIDRATDKLAVNQKWAGANKSNIVESNTTLEEMMGSW